MDVNQAKELVDVEDGHGGEGLIDGRDLRVGDVEGYDNLGKQLSLNYVRLTIYEMERQILGLGFLRVTLEFQTTLNGLL